MNTRMRMRCWYNQGACEQITVSYIWCCIVSCCIVAWSNALWYDVVWCGMVVSYRIDYRMVSYRAMCPSVPFRIYTCRIVCYAVCGLRVV